MYLAQKNSKFTRFNSRRSVTFIFFEITNSPRFPFPARPSTAHPQTLSSVREAFPIITDIHSYNKTEFSYEKNQKGKSDSLGHEGFRWFKYEVFLLGFLQV